MRMSGTLLLVLPLVLAVGPMAHARILGGGVKASDCYLYFDGIDATKGKFVVECKDNQPCDADTIAKQCTFRFTVCTGAPDVAGCTPADVTGFRGGKGIQNLPHIGPAACATAPSDVVVKLKRSSKVNKRTIKITALAATGKPKRDLDTLVLKCMASPSGAFVFE